MNMRGALVTIVATLPASKLKNSLLRRLGWAIGARAHIGPCLVFSIGSVDIGDGAWIGGLNVVKGLTTLTLGPHAVIVHWNWVTAYPAFSEVGAPCSLHMGAHSAITSRHYIECTGGIRVGSHTTIGGERSTFFTRGVSWRNNAQAYNPIEIGDYCLITSNVQVCP
ncbi:MAG: hypothetical protein PHQ28_06045, partial [Mycobacterium sp.]|nr:hypothetical protein [Mycobacterium sp.]